MKKSLRRLSEPRCSRSGSTRANAVASRVGKLSHFQRRIAGAICGVASGFAEDAGALLIRSDARVLGATLSAGQCLFYRMKPGRKAYMVATSGQTLSTDHLCFEPEISVESDLPAGRNQKPCVPASFYRTGTGGAELSPSTRASARINRAPASSAKPLASTTNRPVHPSLEMA